MRSTFALTCASLALGAAVACAASDEAAEPPSNDAGPSPLADAGADGEGPRDAPIVPTCSSAGWCITPLPDPDLTLKDIRPFEGGAFAIAESVTLGVKVLEWDEAERAWRYIDDDSQNSFEHRSWAGKLWAPNENELYFGAGPGFVYHGKRATPASRWSWESSRLALTPPPPSGREPGHVGYRNLYDLPVEAAAIGVWGTSADDVYAWYGNTIFHWKSADGGSPAWVAEYTADDVDSPGDTFFVFDASGSGQGDIWFGGARARYDDWGIFRCPIAIHKTPAGYRRVVDHTIDGADVSSHYHDTCVPKDGALPFTWATGKDIRAWTNASWFTNIESIGAGRAVGILGDNLFAYVTSDGAGLARVNRVAAQVPRDLLPSLLNSVWVHDSEAWFSGWGLVLRSANDPAKWSTGLGLYTPDEAQDRGLDAATFAFSPTAINGAPLDKPLYQVRGTSNTNLWAIGFHHALHKTTP